MWATFFAMFKDKLFVHSTPCPQPLRRTTEAIGVEKFESSWLRNGLCRQSSSEVYLVSIPTAKHTTLPISWYAHTHAYHWSNLNSTWIHVYIHISVNYACIYICKKYKQISMYTCVYIYIYYIYICMPACFVYDFGKWIFHTRVSLAFRISPTPWIGELLRRPGQTGQVSKLRAMHGTNFKTRTHTHTYVCIYIIYIYIYNSYKKKNMAWYKMIRCEITDITKHM